MPENAHVFDRGAREAILGVSEGITGLLIHATGRTGKSLCILFTRLTTVGYHGVRLIFHRKHRPRRIKDMPVR